LTVVTVSADSLWLLEVLTDYPEHCAVERTDGRYDILLHDDTLSMLRGDDPDIDQAIAALWATLH
jgi:hypothetical protein